MTPGDRVFLNYDPPRNCSRDLFDRMTEMRAGVLTDLGLIPPKVSYITYFLTLSDRLWDPPSLLFSGYGVSSPGVKLEERETENAWSYTSYAVTSWSLIKHRDTCNCPHFHFRKLVALMVYVSLYNIYGYKFLV
jgi:hypothetical protein